MNTLRNFIDGYYERNRELIFEETEHDPELAHEKFVNFSRFLYKTGLDRLLLDCSENKSKPKFEISNAAGFNKNCDIPPKFLKYLGFDRVVIGTVTYEPCHGNPHPRIKRYPETESMVNWMGLPGIGAEAVANKIEHYGNHKIPITMNIMATPGKKGEALLKDLKDTIEATRDLQNLDRYELNISCPNTHASSGCIDSRREYQKQLSAMLDVMRRNKYGNQDVFIKVSPDMEENDIETTIQTAEKYYIIRGFTTTNTTTFHDSTYITSHPNKEGKGGASGNAVYERAKRVQELFYKKIKETVGYDLIACGGINSLERAKERTSYSNVIGIQIFTPLIFKGPRLLRELRKPD